MYKRSFYHVVLSDGTHRYPKRLRNVLKLVRNGSATAVWREVKTRRKSLVERVLRKEIEMRGSNYSVKFIPLNKK